MFCPINTEIIALKPFTKYHVEVKAYNFAGEGQTAHTMVVTEQEAPSGPPRNLFFEIINARNVTLTWIPPERPNGVLTYEIYLIDKGNFIFVVYLCIICIKVFLCAEYIETTSLLQKQH